MICKLVSRDAVTISVASEPKRVTELSILGSSPKKKVLDPESKDNETLKSHSRSQCPFYLGYAIHLPPAFVM